MSTFLAINLTVIVLSLVSILRSRIVLRHHLRYLAELSVAIDTAIKDGTFEFSMFDHFARVGNFDLHMLDLTKWTYRQFYPQRNFTS